MVVEYVNVYVEGRGTLLPFGEITLLPLNLTMPLNIPGILVPFQLLLYPRLVIPSILVKGKIFTCLTE